MISFNNVNSSVSRYVLLTHYAIPHAQGYYPSYYCAQPVTHCASCLVRANFFFSVKFHTSSQMILPHTSPLNMQTQLVVMRSHTVSSIIRWRWIFSYNILCGVVISCHTEGCCWEGSDMLRQATCLQQVDPPQEVWLGCRRGTTDSWSIPFLTSFLAIPRCALSDPLCYSASVCMNNQRITSSL